MITLRLATPEDCYLLFQWVNSPDALAGKLLTQKPIELATHNAWFVKRLNDPDTFIWIIELYNLPIGQLRFEKLEIDIYLVPEYRHCGYARKALEQGIGKAKGTLKAVVKTENVNSRRLFERSGFILIEQSDKYLVYTLDTCFKA